MSTSEDAQAPPSSSPTTHHTEPPPPTAADTTISTAASPYLIDVAPASLPETTTDAVPTSDPCVAEEEEVDELAGILEDDADCAKVAGGKELFTAEHLQKVKECWLSSVVKEAEQAAGVENSVSQSEKDAELRWAWHLLRELLREVRRGSLLTLEELHAEVGWIRESAKKTAREGVASTQTSGSAAAELVQKWLEAAKNAQQASNIAPCKSRSGSRMPKMPKVSFARPKWPFGGLHWPQKTVPCSTENMTYEPFDMDSHLMTTESSPAACQARCRRIDGCAHFSYWEPAGHCHVHDAFAVAQPHRLLFVSGPSSCNLLQRGKESLSILRKKITKCYQPNTVYSPYDVMMLPVKTHCIEKCQNLCRRTSGCAHFSYWTLDGSCHLSSNMEGEQRLSGVANFVSGPPRCLEPPSAFQHMQKRFLEPTAASAGDREYTLIPAFAHSAIGTACIAMTAMLVFWLRRSRQRSSRVTRIALLEEPDESLE